MNPEQLETIGKKLYGNRWKAPLARELGLTRETIYHYAVGNKAIPKKSALAIKQLELTIKPRAYKEKRYNAKGEQQKIGNALVIHADSRNYILEQKVDVILTDPVWPKSLNELAGSEQPMKLFEEVINNLTQYLNPNGRIIVQLRVDSDPRILKIPEQFPFIRVVWLPYAVPSRQGRLLISGDVGYIFGSPPDSKATSRILPGQIHKDFAPPAPPNKVKTKHPCPRHLTHVEWLIEKFTEPTDVVLDPFIGSGTTGVACKIRGRDFIGIEIERKYYNEAVDRLIKLDQDAVL